MFETFAEYMFSLLFGPLKKVQKHINQAYVFFKVIGKLFDENKEDFFRIREDCLIMSCNEIILSEFGKERDMPRLEGEAIDNYRVRLMQKNEIAQQAGTSRGIENALADAGYKGVYLEPFYLYEPERWAEFIVYLGENQVGVVTDITRIDQYVSKLKPASAKANYIAGTVREIVIQSKHNQVGLVYPMCGLQRCGEAVNLY